MFSRRVKIFIVVLLLPTLIVNNVYPQLARLRQEAAARAAAAKTKAAATAAAAKAKAAQAAEAAKTKAAELAAASKAAAEKVVEEARAAKERATAAIQQRQASQNKIMSRRESRPVIDWAKATFQNLKDWVTNADVKAITLDLGFPDQRDKTPITTKEEFEAQAKQLAEAENKDLGSIGIVYLEQNKLTELSADFFQIVPNVAEVYLANNNIETIDPKAFDVVISDSTQKIPLEYLDLARNNISTLSPAAFAGLDDLKQVILAGNPITDFDNKVGSEQIKALNAQHPIPANAIARTVSGGIQLDSRGIFLKRSNYSTKKQLARAGTAGIAKIKTQGVFSGDMRERIKGFAKGNIGYTITSKAQEPFVNLARRLATMFCNAGYVEIANKLAAFRPVEEVVLNLANEDMKSFNKLNDIAKELNYDPANFNKITMLRLSGNQLKSIPDDYLGRTFPQLKALDLSNNKIESIGPNAFRGLSFLKILLLSDNPIKTFDPIAIQPDTLLSPLKASETIKSPLKFVSLGKTDLSRGKKGDIKALREASGAWVIKSPITKRMYLAYVATTGIIGLIVLAIFAAPAAGIVAGIIGPGSVAFDLLSEWAMGTFGQPPFIDKITETVQEMIAERKESQGLLFKGGGERKVKGIFRAGKAKIFEKLGWQVGQENILDLSNELMTSLDQIPTKAEELYYDPAAFKDVTIIRLPRNNITIIPAHAFAAFPKVKAIDLSGNLIETIAPGAFENLRELKFLLLGDNQITSFPADAVNGCTSLKLITIGKNPIAAGYNLRERFEKDEKLENNLSRKEGRKLYFKTKTDKFNEKKAERQQNRAERKEARQEKQITECPVPDDSVDETIIDDANREDDAEAEGSTTVPPVPLEEAPIDPETSELEIEDVASEAEKLTPEQAEQALENAPVEPVATEEEQSAVAVEFEKVNQYAEIVAAIKIKVCELNGISENDANKKCKWRVITRGLDRQRLVGAIKLAGVAAVILVLLLGAKKLGLFKKVNPESGVDDLTDDAIRLGGEATTAPTTPKVEVPSITPTPGTPVAQPAIDLVEIATKRPADLQILTPKQITESLNLLSPDDAAQVLGKLSTQKRVDVLKVLPEGTLNNLPDEELAKFMGGLEPEDFVTVGDRLSETKLGNVEKLTPASKTSTPTPKETPTPEIKRPLAEEPAVPQTPVRPPKEPLPEPTVPQTPAPGPTPISTLPAEDISQLTAKQLDALTEPQIKSLDVTKLTSDQIEGLSNVQASRFTPEQIGKLDIEDQQLIKFKHGQYEEDLRLAKLTPEVEAPAPEKPKLTLVEEVPTEVVPPAGPKPGTREFVEATTKPASVSADDWALLTPTQKSNLNNLIKENPSNDQVIFEYMRTISPAIQAKKPTVPLRWDITAEQLGKMTPEQLDDILIQGIPSENIKFLNPDTFGKLPTDELNKLTPDQIASLSNQQIQVLNAQQINNLTELQLKNLNTKALTPDQINALSNVQAEYLTTAQIDELAPTQKAIIELKRKQLVGQKEFTILPKESPLGEPRLAQLTPEQISSARNTVGAERWDALSPSEQYYVTQLNIQGKQSEIDSFLIAEESTRKALAGPTPVTKAVPTEPAAPTEFVRIIDPETGKVIQVPKERTVIPELPPVKEIPKVGMPEGLNQQQQAFFNKLSPEEKGMFTKLTKSDIDQLAKLSAVNEKMAKRELFRKSLTKGSTELDAMNSMDNFAQRYFDQLPTSEEKMIFLELHGTTNEGMNKARQFADELGIKIPETETSLKTPEERALIAETFQKKPTPKPGELTPEELALFEKEEAITRMINEQREVLQKLPTEVQDQVNDLLAKPDELFRYRRSIDRLQGTPQYADEIANWKSQLAKLQDDAAALSQQYPELKPMFEQTGIGLPELSAINPIGMTDDVIERRLALASLDEWANLTPAKRNEFAQSLLSPDELKAYSKLTKPVDQLNYLKLNTNERSVYLKLMSDPMPSKKAFYANSSPEERAYFVSLSSNKVPSLDEQAIYMNLPRSLRTEMAQGATPSLTPTLARDLNIKTAAEWNTFLDDIGKKLDEIGEIEPVSNVIDDLTDYTTGKELTPKEELTLLQATKNNLTPENQVLAQKRIDWLQEVSDVSNKSDWDALKTTLKSKSDENIDDRLAILERYLQSEQWSDLPVNAQIAEWQKLTPTQQAALWNALTPEEKINALFQAKLWNRKVPITSPPSPKFELPAAPQSPAPRPKTPLLTPEIPTRTVTPIIPVIVPRTEEKEEESTTVKPPEPPEPPTTPPPVPPLPPAPPVPPKAPPAPEPRKRGYARQLAEEKGLI